MRITEAKDHLINRLNLTQEQKDKLIALFRKYPNLESKIDWNNRNLKWEDFKSLLYDAGKSKSQALKKGIEGLKEGTDYRIVAETEEYIVYYPMTHLASKVLASDRVAPHKTARWCISTNDPSEWNQYTRDYGVDFFFFFGKDIDEDGEVLEGEKFAIARYPESMKSQLIPKLERNHLPYNRDEVLCEIFTENDVSLTEHDYRVWPFRAYGFNKDRISEEAWPSYFESPEDWMDRLRANNPNVQAPEEDEED